MEPLSSPRTPVRRERVGVRRYGGAKSGASVGLLVTRSRVNLGETSGKSRTNLDLDHIYRTLHRTLRKLGRTLHKLGGCHRRPTSKIDPSSPDLPVPVNSSQANKSYE